MKPIINFVHIISVADCRKTASFFCDVLGFSLVDKWPEGWKYVERDGCAIGIQEVKDIRPASELQEHSWIAYVEVIDPDQLYDELRSAGVTFSMPLTVQECGAKEFHIITPDGHQIMFAGSIAQ